MNNFASKSNRIIKSSTENQTEIYPITTSWNCRSSTRWGMINSLFLATVLRTGLVILSYGCKVPAGIFVPSMAVGATFGRMVGILVKTMHM